MRIIIVLLFFLRERGVAGEKGRERERAGERERQKEREREGAVEREGGRRGEASGPTMAKDRVQDEVLRTIIII